MGGTTREGGGGAKRDAQARRDAPTLPTAGLSGSKPPSSRRKANHPLHPRQPARTGAMADLYLKALESERKALWATCRLKGLSKDTPERKRIVELDRLLAEHKGKKG